MRVRVIGALLALAGAAVAAPVVDFIPSANSTHMTEYAGTDVQLPGDSDFTWEAWVKPSSTGLGWAENRVFGQTNWKDEGRLILEIRKHSKDTGNVPKLALFYRLDGANKRTMGRGTLDGNWAHVAVTRQGANLKVYLNGVLDAEADDYAGPLPTTTAVEGASDGYFGFGYAFSGAMSEVRVWNRVRTAAEIAATMNRRLEAKADGLVGRWALDALPAGLAGYNAGATAATATVADDASRTFGTDGVWIGGEGLWSDPANWKGGHVPNGPADTAAFSSHTPAVVRLDQTVALNRIFFTGADHLVTSNGTAIGRIDFHPDAAGAAEVRVERGCNAEIVAHAYPSGSKTVDLVKAGGGRVTFTRGYMNGNEYRSVDVKGGVWEHAKGMASGDFLKVSTVRVRKGATFRYVSPNNVCNWAVFDLEEGATLDCNGQTDLVGSLRGAGRVVNLTSQVRFGFKSGDERFTGTVSGTGQMVLHHDAKYPADYPVDTGLVVARPDALRDMRAVTATKNWNDAVKFAAGNADYWMQFFYGPEGQTFLVQDEAGGPINLHVATVQDGRNYAGPGSLELWGGNSCTISGTQVQVAGALVNASTGGTVTLGDGAQPVDLSTVSAVVTKDFGTTALRAPAAQTVAAPFAVTGGVLRLERNAPVTLTRPLPVSDGMVQFDPAGAPHALAGGMSFAGSSTLACGDGASATLASLAREGRGVLFLRNVASAQDPGTGFTVKVDEAPAVASGRTVLPVFQELYDSSRGAYSRLRPLSYDAEKGFVPAVLTPGLAGGAASVAYVTSVETLSADAHVGALVVECAPNQARLTIAGGATLKVGDGVNPACVLLANNGSMWSYAAANMALSGGSIDFGTSEGVFVAGSTTGDYIYYTCVHSTIKGSGGVVFAAPSDGAQYRRQFSLNASNPYTGGTWIKGAIVRIANNGAFGADDVWVTGDGHSGGQIKTYATAVTLPNNLHLSGMGQYGTFDTDYAQQAGAILVAGDLALNGTVELTGDTRATVFAPYTCTFANTVSGPGAFELRGNGTFVFRKPNGWAGATTIGVNTDVSLADGATLGQGPIEVNGTLTFNNASPITVPNRLTGSGTVVFAGSAKVTFADAAAFAGQFRVARELDLAGTDMTLSALTGVGSVVNSGEAADLTVATDFDVAYPGSLGGASTSLVKDGAGMLTLSGANAYGGDTRLLAGGIRLGTASAQATLAITDGLVCRLDATAAGTVTRAADGPAENVCAWTDADGRGISFTNANTATVSNGQAQEQFTAVEGAINGKDALHVNGYLNHLECDRNFTAGSIFIVHQGIAATTHPNASFGGDNWSCNGIFGFARTDNGLRTKDRLNWQYDCVANPPGVIYVDGTKTGRRPEAAPYVLSCNFDKNYTGRFALGCYWYNGKNGANFRQRTMPGDIGEVVIYDRQLDEFERDKVGEYLATKWLATESGAGAGVVATNVLPSATDLTMATGTTLDLNGSVQTVASLAGDGAIGDGKGGGMLLVGAGSFDGAISGGFGLTENGAFALGDTCTVADTVSLHLAAGSVLDLGGKTISVAHLTGTGTWVNGRIIDLGHRGTVILFR